MDDSKIKATVFRQWVVIELKKLRAAAYNAVLLGDAGEIAEAIGDFELRMIGAIKKIYSKGLTLDVSTIDDFLLLEELGERLYGEAWEKKKIDVANHCGGNSLEELPSEKLKFAILKINQALQKKGGTK